MKVVHINTADRAGGAAIAAYRQNEALNRAGHDSKMLVVNHTSGIKSVGYPPGKANKLKGMVYARLNHMLTQRLRPYATWTYPRHGFDLSSHPAVKDADLIVLHWINGGILSIAGVEKLLRTGKPVVWFLHDMWPMTGGCHYSLECDKYQSHCGACPLLYDKAGSGKIKDMSYKQFEEKLRRWSKYDNLRIVAPSEWLAGCARKSRIFGGLDISVCRNVIDTDKFRYYDKAMARRMLQLPADKKLILFGADSLKSPYKGWPYLRDALEGMAEDVECVVFGSGDLSAADLPRNIRIHQVGKLGDDYSLILLYNACDVFVTPSIADNFPNVVLEGMACGLPCVGFNIGGVPEMIQHFVTGYISQEISAYGLRDGLSWVLTQPIASSVTSLGANCRQWALTHCSYPILTNNLYGLTKT